MDEIIKLKLSDGAEVINEIISMAKEKGIEYGLFTSVAGSISNFELALTNSSGGKKKFNGIYEVDSISGYVKRDEVNLRITASSTGFTPVSGRLLNGKSVVLEIGVRKIGTKKMIGE